jgi:hypothetical protein
VFTPAIYDSSGSPGLHGNHGRGLQCGVAQGAGPEGLLSEGYIKTIDVPSSSFNCNLVPETRYEQGTPVIVSYP